MDERSRRKTRIGNVVNNKMDKTCVVEVKTIVKHPAYKKIIRKSKNYMVDDANNETNIGDIVKIMETRPLSRNKNWRIVEILERAK